MRCSNGKSDSVRMKFTFWFKCLANEKDLSRTRPVPFWSLVSSLSLFVSLPLPLTCSSFPFFFSFFLYLSRRFSTFCLFHVSFFSNTILSHYLYELNHFGRIRQHVEIFFSFFETRFFPIISIELNHFRSKTTRENFSLIRERKFNIKRGRNRVDYWAVKTTRRMVTTWNVIDIH